MVSNNTNLNTIERDQTPYYQYYDPNPTYYYEYYDPDSNVSDGNSQPPQGWPVVETQTFEQNYLYENQNINENINLEATLLGHTHRPDPTPSQQSANAKLALMSKVYDKLGEEKLKEIFKKQDIAIYTTIRELLDDCLNKFYRLFGLGYEFSDKEAREAIADNFNTNYSAEDKSFFGFDKNTRFAYLLNEKGISKKEAAPIAYLAQSTNESIEDKSGQHSQRLEKRNHFKVDSNNNMHSEVKIKEDQKKYFKLEQTNDFKSLLCAQKQQKSNPSLLIV
jgi:hypothetical protein